MRLQDRVAVVTGSAGGLGRAIAETLAEEGARVVISDVDGSALETASGEMENAGGTVIGVNVSPRLEKAQAYRFGSSISGWQVLWNRINPSKRVQVPTLATSLIRSLEISSVHRIKSQRKFVDVLIQPDVRQFGLLDFSSYESIAEAGYRTARKQLALWQDRKASLAGKGVLG